MYAIAPALAHFGMGRPVTFLSLGHKSLREVGTDGATGTHEGIDGEIFIAAEHLGDAGGTDAHALCEFGAGNALALHELEQLFDNREFTDFNLGLDSCNGFRKVCGQWVMCFGNFKVHGLVSAK